MAKAPVVSLEPAARASARRADLPTVDAVVARDRPTDPLVCLRPAAIAAAARRFVEKFPGDVLYAVKCNPDPRALRAVWAGGVRHFDCASLPEIALVQRVLPGAAVHFMHPVKRRDAIHAAFARHGVTDFAFDSADELEKIVQETVPVGLVGAPPSLGLFLRLAVGQGGAYDLSGKFGAGIGEAAGLLRRARPHAARLGVCFHVGSQCLDPAAYRAALALASEAAARARIAVEVIDVGGGFPVSYKGTAPPPLDDYIRAIREEAAARFSAGVELWAEPGRALVAGGGSLVVQVLLRRGDALYVNDGVYGSLSDAGRPGFRFPARRIALDRAEGGAEMRSFALFGPTCDSADRMPGPFLLPADTDEGDWIEIGQLGAYGACLRTGFNGFDSVLTAEVADPPLLPTPGYE